jgi:hypothetical protein
LVVDKVDQEADGATAQFFFWTFHEFASDVCKCCGAIPRKICVEVSNEVLFEGRWVLGSHEIPDHRMRLDVVLRTRESARDFVVPDHAENQPVRQVLFGAIVLLAHHQSAGRVALLLKDEPERLEGSGKRS